MSSPASTFPSPVLRALFARWIDYAGPFPPASQSLTQAIDEFSQHRGSSAAWLLNRLVVKLSDLPAIEQRLAALPGDSDAPLPLSVVVGSNWTLTREQVSQPPGMLRHCRIEALEGRWDTSAAPVWRELVDRGCELFVEVSPGTDQAEQLTRIRQSGACAKLRTGGVLPDQIPSTQMILEFLSNCRALDLPYKLTAGLHHAWPGNYPLTYEPNAPTASMHGFLPVAVAALMLESDHQAQDAARAILEESSPEVIRIDEHSIHWRDQSWSSSACEELRRKRLKSVGSCSFTEPLADLIQIAQHASTAR